MDVIRFDDTTLEKFKSAAKEEDLSKTTILELINTIEVYQNEIDALVGAAAEFHRSIYNALTVALDKSRDGKDIVERAEMLDDRFVLALEVLSRYDGDHRRARRELERIGSPRVYIDVANKDIQTIYKAIGDAYGSWEVFRDHIGWQEIVDRMEDSSE